MKAVFFHDHKLKVCNNQYYLSGGLSYSVLKRYFLLCDELIVCTRKVDIEENEISKYEKVCDNNLIMKPIGVLYNPIAFMKNNSIFKSIIKDIIQKVDIVIIRMPSVIGNIAYVEAVRQNKKILVEDVGCPFDSLWNYNIKGKILAPFMWYITKKNIKSAPYVMYVSEKFLPERYPTKGEFIACSDVILEEVNEQTLNNRMSKISNDGTEKIVLGTLAAIDVKYKGQADVIKAIAKLNKEGANYEYQLVGGGNKQRLEQLAIKLGIKDNVKFLGTMPHNEIFKWLDDIDIYMQPSKQEGLCRAIVEALSRACPCIVSNAGGNIELVQKKYVYKKGKYKEIVRLLKNMTCDEMLEQSKKNFEHAKQYSVDVLNDKRVEFYKNVIGG